MYFCCLKVILRTTFLFVCMEKEMRKVLFWNKRKILLKWRYILFIINIHMKQVEFITFVIGQFQIDLY